MSVKIGIVELYCGGSGKKGFYNSQEIGIAKEFVKRGYECLIFKADKSISQISEEIIDCNPIEEFTDKEAKGDSPVGKNKSIKYIKIPARSLGVHGLINSRLLDRYNIDVFQVAGDNQLFLPILVKHLKKKNYPFYYYLGVIHSNSQNKLVRKLMDVLIRKNIRLYRQGKCFVKTEALKTECLALGIKDVETAPVGLDFSIIPEITETQLESKRTLSKAYNLDPTKKWLLFVGRMEEYKRPLEVFGIYKALCNKESKSGNGWQLIMIGTGSLDESVDNEIKHTETSGGILHIRQIENKNMFNWYNAADCFINLNPDEIFGMSMMEAQIEGCRVVAVKAPGSCEIIKEGLNGYIVGSKEDAADYIDKELDSEKIRQYALEKYSWSGAADSIEKYIKLTTSNA